MKKIKPVLRYVGSKYKKIDKIIELLNIQKDCIFIDLFGGSGIVGVNVQHLFSPKHVIINDYDDVLNPIKEEFAVDNMLRFDGYGSYSQSAHDYFIRRIDNGYWPKFDKYNEIISKTITWSMDITNQKNIENIKAVIQMNSETAPVKIYVDPPYFEIKGLYKNEFNPEKHFILKEMLDELSKIPNVEILISYNDNQTIRTYYNRWTIIEEEYQYSSGSSQTRKKQTELWITNKEKNSGKRL